MKCRGVPLDLFVMDYIWDIDRRMAATGPRSNQPFPLPRRPIRNVARCRHRPVLSASPWSDRCSFPCRTANSVGPPKRSTTRTDRATPVSSRSPDHYRPCPNFAITRDAAGQRVAQVRERLEIHMLSVAGQVFFQFGSVADRGQDKRSAMRARSQRLSSSRPAALKP